MFEATRFVDSEREIKRAIAAETANVERRAEGGGGANLSGTVTTEDRRGIQSEYTGLCVVVGNGESKLRRERSFVF